MKKYSLETIVGIFVVIGLLCIGYMTIKLGKIPIFSGDYYFSMHVSFQYQDFALTVLLRSTASRSEGWNN